MFVTVDAFGFAYYDVYLTDSAKPVAWIFRIQAMEPYQYSIFYCDGKNAFSTTRGSAHNARNAVRELVSKYNPA